MKPKQKSFVLGYGLAILSTLLATWLRMWAHPYLGDQVLFITYFPAVFVTALYAGFWPAVVTVLLSSLAAAHFFMLPADRLMPQDLPGWAALGLFDFFGISVGLLCDRMHRKSQLVRWESERYSVTLASIGDAVIVTDMRGRVTLLNAAAARLTGWGEDEAQGQPLESVYRLLDESTHRLIENPALQAIRNGKLFKHAAPAILVSKAGLELAIDESAAPIRGRDGQIVGVVLVFRDFSEQRAAQLERGRLAALVDSSEDAIIGQTFEGVITNWNGGAEHLFGYTAEQTVGHSMFTTIVPPDRKQELLDTLRLVQQGERLETFETERVTLDGRRLPIAVRISPIYDANDRIVGASAIDRDISQQRATERRRNARLLVTQILATERNVDKALTDILAAVCEALQWTYGCVWRVDSQKNVLRCQQIWQHDQSGTHENLEAFRIATLNAEFTSGLSLPGRVWKTRQAAWIPDVMVEPAFVRAPQARSVGLHGGFACPLMIDDEFLGVIEFFSYEIRQPDDDLLEMMATIGGQIGQFIERREAERKLRRTQHELSDFFENAAVGLHWVGPDGIILRANRAELEMLGYQADEYVGQNIAKFHVDRPVIDNILHCLSTGQQLHNYESRLRCKDGTIKHVLIDSNVLWEDGKFVHTRCFTRDISERKRAEASLHESEQRLRLALDAGRMGNWEWDIASGRVIWSSTLEQIHGIPVGSFPGTFEAYQSDIHPDDRQLVLETIRQTVEQRHEHQLEYRIIWPDNSVHWLEAKGKLFEDQRGNPVRVVGVCCDVTKRKSLEQRLRSQLEELADAEARTRSIVDHAIDGIVTIDDQGDIVSFNPAAEQIFAYRAAEVIGKPVTLLVPELASEDPTQSIDISRWTHHENTTAVGHEMIGLRKDGSQFFVDLAASEFRLGQRRLVTGILRDITDRKRIEQSLRFLAEASKSLSLLVDYKSTLQKMAHLAVPDFADWCAIDMLEADGSFDRLAIAHVDPDKVRLAEQLYHRYPPDPGDTIGTPHVIRTGEPEIASNMSDSLLVEAAHDQEHLELLRALQLRSYICVPLKVHDRVLGAITFVSSESGRMYGNEDLDMAKDLAHCAAVAIENARLYQKLREADRRKDEFLAMLAHELRNPLVPIRSGLDILAMESSVDRSTIELMQEQVEHVVRLVDDLLDVSRIMRNKVELRRESVELSTVVKRSVDAVRTVVDGHKQQLTVSQPEQPIWLYADPVRVVQVIENLLNNASKYMDSGGKIELTVKLEHETAVISVRDTGVGIEPELLPSVFELFTQASRSLDRAQGGLGIGLTLVQRLVEMHDGTVSASSAGLGHGSTFTVRLPVIAAPLASAAPSAIPDTQQGRRLVVVDDNVSAAWLMSKLLGKLGDHEIHTAHDGKSALEMITRVHPEIVLLDIGLPGMDGYEVGRAIRANPLLDDVLLVALTGYGQSEDRQRSKQAGFDEHLVKPPSVDQIRTILSHPKLSEVPGK